jgi:vancomycin permeability regulator SanA
MGATVIVLFGAAVRADGTPSPTLKRRIYHAMRAATTNRNALVFCSGGKGVEGPSEASIMKQSLLAEISNDRIFMDEESRDTLQSVIAATSFLCERNLTRCVVCTDSYHGWRVRLLFAMLGIRTKLVPYPALPNSTPFSYWLRMRLREVPAIFYDVVLLLIAMRRGAVKFAIGR